MFKDIIVTAFYWIVLKMINFWDTIYFEKIEFIYNSDFEFQKDELKELAFEYSRALHKVKMNKQRKYCYLTIYASFSAFNTWGFLFYF